MRKIFTLFAALMMVLSMNAATKTIYCKMAQSWWKADGAAVGAYYWEPGSAPAWPGVRMTPVTGETDLWSVDIDTDKYTKIIFTRVNGSGTVSDWGAKTADLILPTDDKNLYTITSTSPVWGNPGVAGNWSVYAPDAPKTYKDITITIVANATPKIHYWEGGDKMVGTEWGNLPEMTATGEANTYSCTIKDVDEATGVKYLVMVGDIQSADQQAFENVNKNFKELLAQVSVMGIPDWTGSKMTVADDYLSASVTLTLDAAKDYEFKLTINGEWFGSKDITITKDNNSAAFAENGDGNGKLTTDLAGDYVFTYTYATKTLVVTYPVPTYTVTVTAENGTVEGDGEYKEGTEVTLTATPAEGYKFVNWTVGEEVVSTENPYTFTVTADIALVANFEEAAPEYALEETVEIANLTTETLTVGEATYLQLTGRNDMLDSDVQLFLNNYTGEDKEYEVNVENSLMTFGGIELTVVEGKIAQATDPEKGKVYTGRVIASAEEEGEVMLVALDLVMYATPAVEVAIADATARVDEETGSLVLNAEWTKDGVTYPVFVTVAGYEEGKEVYEGAQISELQIGDDDNWLDFAVANTVTVAQDGQNISVEGEYTSWATGTAYALTISGKLPVVEPEVIEYVLNGGVLPLVGPTNAELWEMFKPYYNTYYGLTRADQAIDKVSTFAATYMQKIMTDEASEYKWLGDYVQSVATAAGVTLSTDMASANEGGWRWAVHAFFNAAAGQHGAAGIDFTEAGKPENWVNVYPDAQEVVLPTEPVAEDYVLPTPTKEGYTFVGWYDNAEGEGDAYTVILAGWAGTLYAIWEVEGPATALENIAVEGKAVKAIINGQLIIIKNGVQYNAQGAILK